MDKLKSCPFCGGEINAPTQPFLNVEDHDYCIGCVDCDIFLLADTKQEAIEAWNRRVGEE